MIDLTAVPYNTGSFPNVVANDSTTGTSTDGTPLIEDWVRDLFGFEQAILYHAGKTTASGSNETYNTGTGLASSSEILESIQRVSGHPGELIPWMGTLAIPTGIRLLEMTGQVITIASYQDLADSVYVGNGLNPTAPAFYKTSDAGGTTRSTGGAYMVMPDLVGVFLRGLDTAEKYDADGSSRALGDYQANALGKHTHKNIFGLNSEQAKEYGEDFYSNADMTGGTTSFYILSNISTTDFYTGYNNEVPVSPAPVYREDDNRPHNSAVRWCIRY